MTLALLVALSAAPSRAQDLTPMIPMRDGTRLSTDIYLPDGSAPWPVVLVRTPYNKRTDMNDPAWVAEVNDHGYAYVVQDMRGRFASEGMDSTFWTDGWGANQDGYDTIEWLATQPWCDGNVGMFGESARAIAQYLAAGAAPPSLKACIAIIGCDEFYQKAFFQGGELRKELVEGWYDRQNAEHMLPFFYAHPTDDEFWDYFDLAAQAPQVTVPILHIGGHYDIFGESAIDAFNSLQTSGGVNAAGHQRLVLGPWSHYEINERVQGEILYPPSAIYDLETLRWRWFDHWLKGVANGVDEDLPVSYYLMGDPYQPGAPGNYWINTDVFPPPQAIPTAFYLHGPDSPTPRLLRTVPPPVVSDAFWYETDPRDPIQTRGGRNLYLLAGPYDQEPVHFGRTDGIEVATAPLQAPVTVTGKIVFRFWGSCSVPDTDWCVKLIDAYPNGRKMLVTDGVLRARFRNGFEVEEPLTPWAIYPFEVDLWSTAIVFATGHRIMVSVSNANYTRFELNPQTGLPFGAPSDTLMATVSIQTDADHPSHLLLPVVYDFVAVGQNPGTNRPGPALSPARNPARRFELRVVQAAPGPVIADVYAVSGRAVRQLPGSAGPAGFAELRWDGDDAGGRRLPPGVYYVRLRDASGRTASESVTLVR